METELTGILDEIGIILFLLSAIVFLTSLVIWSLRNGISPMPSTKKAKKAIFSMIPRNIHGTIYDLGCGWGSLLIPLAKQHPQCQVIGFETSPIPYWFCCLMVKLSGLPNAHVKRQNFYTVDLKEASLVVCYLYPQAMQKLKSKFLIELRPGTPIISNTFAINDWDPERIFSLQDIYHTKIYFYRIPRTTR